MLQVGRDERNVFVFSKQFSKAFSRSVIKILVNAIFMGLLTFIFYCYCHSDGHGWWGKGTRKLSSNVFRYLKVIKDHDTSIYLRLSNSLSLSALNKFFNFI